MVKLTATPFDFQIEAINYGNRHNYILNADEMGLGKSLEAIAVAINTEGQTTVCCPAFLKYNWMGEFLKFTDLKEKDINLITSRKSDLYRGSAKVNIVNYAILSKVESLFEHSTMVIADEAHYLKNLEAQRTDHFHNYIEKYRPERLHLLSGTPIKNRVPDFYSLLKLLSLTEIKNNGKSILDSYPTQYRFNNHFSNRRVFKVPIRGGFGRSVEVTKYEGIKNEAELKSYFRGKFIRRLSRDVLSLPELRRKTVPVTVRQSTDTNMQRAWEGWTGEDGVSVSSIKAASALSKSKHTADYARNIRADTGRGVVIYSDHVKPVIEIAKKLGKTARFITGSTKMEERHEIVTAFQSGSIEYLVATIGAASTGLTLTAASDLVFNDLSWVPSDNAQAEKRIHRIGQKNTCRVHFISGSKVDNMIIKSLQTKQDTIDKLLL